MSSPLPSHSCSGDGMSVTEHKWADLARVAGRSDEQLRHWQHEDQRPGHATDAEKIVLLTDAYRGAVEALEAAYDALVNRSPGSPLWRDAIERVSKALGTDDGGQ